MLPHQIPQVLIIEDDADTRSNMREILGLDHYDISTASSADEALTAAESGDLSAMIIDRRLPDLMVEELIPKLHELSPEAEVIVVTGYADLDGAVAALRLGAADYILKPVNPDELRAGLARIVAHQRALSELRDQDTRLRAIFDSAVEGIITIDDKGVIETFNPAAEAMFGYAAADVCGQNVKVLMPAEQAAEHDRYLRDFQRTGHRKIIGTGRKVHAQRRDGTRFPIHLSVSEVVLGDRRLFTGMIRDVTDLERAEQRMLQSERLAGIGQAMAALAHESRNALQRSQAGIEMLARRVKDQPEAMELINRIERAQDDLYQLYEDVREYAAPLRFQPENTSLGQIVRHAWQDLSVTRKDRTTELIEQGTDQQCEADLFGMRLAFRNILDNSLAAAGDPVRITAQYDEATLSGRPAVQIRLSDNGPGLTAEDRAQIFDEFYTNKTHGTGLGMAICRRIILAHDGIIEAGNSPDGGACITIILPRSQS